MAAHIGKVFENEIQAVFRQLKESHLVGWHRLSDSGAAGSLIAAQPSDYVIGLPPGSVNLLDSQRLIFLEVKASEVKSSLTKDMVRSAQRGAIGVYRHLLNIPYLIMFWDARGGVIELWDGAAIDPDQTRLDKSCKIAHWAGCGVINKLRYAEVSKHIVDHFQIPPKAVTLQKAR